MTIQPIGVPYDLERRGVRMGRTPAALLPLIQAALPDAALPVMVQAAGLEGVQLDDLGRVQGALAAAVRAARVAGHLPLIVGGDCTNAIGALAGLGGSAGGVVWIDAHGDFNTPETSPSGYLGGMPLAVVAGRALEDLRLAAGLQLPLDEAQIVLLGVRDLDPPEQQALEASPASVMTTDEVRQPGEALEAALARLAASGPVYLHLDVDVLDAHELPGVVYPTTSGLTLAELRSLLGFIRERCTIACATLSAVNLEPLDAAAQEAVLHKALTLVIDLVGER